MHLPVTFAAHLTDRVQDLYYQRIIPEGIDLHFLATTPESAFHRMWANEEFEASEMSFSTYIAAIAKNDRRFIAIPVFPSRMFRHSAVYVHTDAGIHEPRDLMHRPVGVPEFQQTAALWIRGILASEYGVDLKSIRWKVGGLHDPGRLQMGGRYQIPGMDIEYIEERSLNDRLISGEIEALISARVPRAFNEGDPRVSRLFPDYAPEERRFYEKTRLFPIMHTVVLRRSFYERYPWVAVSLYQALEEAKNRSLDRLRQAEELTVALPWLISAVDATQAVMGEDFWPYGFSANLNEIQTMCRYSFDQGISPRLVEPEELFAPNVLTLESNTRI